MVVDLRNRSRQEGVEAVSSRDENLRDVGIRTFRLSEKIGRGGFEEG